MPQSNKENGETKLPFFMGASTLETEHRLARLHVLIGVCGCIVSYFLVASGNLMLLHNDISEEDRDSKLEKIETALEQIRMAIEQLRELEEKRIVSGTGLVERYPLREERASFNRNN